MQSKWVYEFEVSVRLRLKYGLGGEIGAPPIHGLWGQPHSPQSQSASSAKRVSKMLGPTRRRALAAAAVLSCNVARASRVHPQLASAPGAAFIQSGRRHLHLSLMRRHHHSATHSSEPLLSSRGVQKILMSTEADASTGAVVDGSYGCFDEDTFDNDDASSSEGDSRSSMLHKALTKAVSKCLKAINKKNASLQRELDKAESLEATMARANLIISNLYRLPAGTTSIEVEDWDNGGELVTLELNTKDYSSAQEEADALFAVGRKMKRGSKVIQELMENSVEAGEVLNDAKLDLEAAGKAADEGMLVLIQERLERTSSKTGFQMPSLDDEDVGSAGKSSAKRQDKKRENQGYRKFTSPSGLQVLVGRNKRQNEAICFKEARQDDVWFHARGCPGAHVLLCVRRGSVKPNEDDLQFAANLAAFYSDARTERRAPVTTADPKHIQKPRGAPPGAVKLRQEGATLVGNPEDVGEELKQAREESGGKWDEMGYRKGGVRAKNKKRAAKADKQSEAKRREQMKEKKKRRQKKQESGDDFY